MPFANPSWRLSAQARSVAALLFISLGLLMPALAKAAATIETAATLNELCQQKSVEHFQRRGQRARNWHSTTVRRGNDYETSAELRVDGETVAITCLAPVGAGKRSMRWQLNRDQ